MQTDQLFISLLTLQEVSFVLRKLNVESFIILEKLEIIEDYCLINFNKLEFIRAKYLATKIGFQNINDCLHVAMAESYCDELYTFNKTDFEKLKPHTSLKISVF